MLSCLARSTKVLKSAMVPRAGRIAVWPPSEEPIAQGLPSSPAAGFYCVVLALAKTFSDGRNGGQVEDVETHFRHIVHAAGHIAQRAVLAGGCRPRTRKKLVPGGKARFFPVYDNFQLAVVPGLERRYPDNAFTVAASSSCNARSSVAGSLLPFLRAFAQADSFALSSFRGPALHLVEKNCTGCKRQFEILLRR